jgi:hypothetical protein
LPDLIGGQRGMGRAGQKEDKGRGRGEMRESKHGPSPGGLLIFT